MSDGDRIKHVDMFFLLSMAKVWASESPSLVLDNWWSLCTNLLHELWYELGWCNPSCEAWWHSNGNFDHMKWWWWSSAQLGKEEKEKQNPMEIKAKV